MSSRIETSMSRRLPTGSTWITWASLVGMALPVQARPTAPTVLCQEQASIPECSGKVAECSLCHSSVDPPQWNGFGAAVLQSLDRDITFEEALPAALADLADQDSDGDGINNGDELAMGTAPGDAESRVPLRPSNGPTEVAPEPPAYDLPFAFRRVNVLYCGRSPSYEEMSTFIKAASTQDASREQLHEALDACLSSEYWQQKALPRLADKRIKPQASLGPDTDLHLGRIRVVLGDYNYDYRLWRYILSSDRDMRELLTADYHVIEADDGTLSVTRELIDKVNPDDLAGGQPLVPERRAGMITTQWFLHLNTMVTALPRTTAAQAYRAYLGADISALEGLMPVAGEPVDVDDKGVDQARCANCHSTLDPLAYAFARYEGAPQRDRMRGEASEAAAPMETMPMETMPMETMPMEGAVNDDPAAEDYDPLANIGGYNENRPFERIPGWDDEVERPHLMGEPVADLIEWSVNAANSDQFKRNLTLMFFQHALGAEPNLAQQAEFNALWHSLPEDEYSANRLIHRLVDTHSFGAPQ